VEFEWDDAKAAMNEAKHGVAFAEAREVFWDQDLLVEYDEGHSGNEDRFSVLGMSSRRLLYVVFCEQVESVIRIIHARKASGVQEKWYEESAKKLQG
jgi:uncharacterized protein